MATGTLGTSGSYLGGIALGTGPLTAVTPTPPPPVTDAAFAIFTPPVVFDRARVVPKRHPGNVLMRHYSPLPRGQNVWLKTDGTVTTNQPWDPALIRRTFHGAMSHPVSADEAALLTAAGYGSYLA